MITLCADIADLIRTNVGSPDFSGLWTILVTETGLLSGHQTQCQWFAMCPRDASEYVPHPVLGAVPVCSSCADKVRRYS